MAARIYNGTLVADEIETLTASPSFVEARIVNVDGVAPIYIRGDGVDPETPWDDCEIIPAAIGYLVVRLSRKGSPTVLKMVSPGTPTYSVKFS